ncbi:MAG TPA: hypothetical protein VL092_05010 [Chitinophagaceae bacterium]|nr:hypothetical protein [Chitinophagaceae bacterium]
MKKLLTIAFLCVIGFAAKAQTSLQVNNNTNCDVFFTINGAPIGCSITTSSVLISLTAFGTVSYSSSTAVPGFPAAPMPLLAAKVFTSSSSCTVFPTSQIIGQPCTGYPLSVSYFILTNPGCSLCRTTPIVATWTPPVPPSTMATLTFN